MSGKISIASQIAEADREVAMRRRVYPEQVRRRKMRETEAEMLIARMEAIAATLRFVARHEADFRAFMTSRQDGESA